MKLIPHQVELELNANWRISIVENSSRSIMLISVTTVIIKYQLGIQLEFAGSIESQIKWTRISEIGKLKAMKYNKSFIKIKNIFEIN